jgi:molybdenum cofactor synthesis domain-containing protein
VKTAALLIVGDEVLSGEVRDENGPWLLARLAALGTRVVRVAMAADRMDDVVHELTRLRALADAVVVSGGIGPTHDDLTRPAVAAALGVPLEEHPEALARIRGWYGTRTTEAEASMALLPRGSRLLNGAKTGTFGFGVAGVYVLPGVPSLFRDIVERLAPEFEGPPLHREEIRTDLREGQIADDLTRIQSRALDVSIGSYPSLDSKGGWHTKIVVRSVDPSRAAAVASDVRTAFQTLSRG